jgi:hypothetical protein
MKKGESSSEGKGLGPKGRFKLKKPTFSCIGNHNRAALSIIFIVVKDLSLLLILLGFF